jgi:deoxyxylulose-5-phosphate synthase
MLYHLENFGLFEFTDFQAGGKILLSQKLKNLRMLLKDPAMMLETGVWPPVIFRRLGLEFLQPLDGRKRLKRLFSPMKKNRKGLG